MTTINPAAQLATIRETITLIQSDHPNRLELLEEVADQLTELERRLDRQAHNVQQAQVLLAAAGSPGHNADELADYAKDAAADLERAHGPLRLELVRYVEELEAAPEGSHIEIGETAWRKTSNDYGGLWTKAADPDDDPTDSYALASELEEHPTQIYAEVTQWGE